MNDSSVVLEESSYSSCNSEKNLIVRWLTPEDEPVFQKLLDAIYGDTYSYHELYKKNGFAKLINSGRLKSRGEFEADGTLVGHTGFWNKDPKNDYVESGLSFRLPIPSKHFASERTYSNWQWLLNFFSNQHSFIHQQTNTYHVLAQRYAMKYMQAVPCGVILEYVSCEKLKNISHSDKPMHALMMTTVLKNSKLDRVIVYIPDFCAEWISSIYQGLNLKRDCVVITVANSKNYQASFEIIEDNQAINLRRRVLKELNTAKSDNGLFLKSSYQKELIHLPLNNADCVAVGTTLLLNEGYLPIGIRPHNQRADELIFQNIIDKKNLVNNIFDEAKFLGEQTNHIIKLWQNTLQQIL